MNRRSLFQFFAAALCASVVPVRPRRVQVVTRLVVDVSGAQRSAVEFQAAMARAKFRASELIQVSEIYLDGPPIKWIEVRDRSVA